MELKDFDTEERPAGKKKKSGGGKVIGSVLLFLCAVTVLAIAIFIVGKKYFTREEEPERTYTEAEVDAMLAEAKSNQAAAVEEAAKTAEENTRAEDEAAYRENLLNAAMEESGIVNLLRETFSDQIVFTNGTKFDFYPINYDLAQNTIDNADLVLDEETGRITYVVDGETKSHLMVDVSSFQKEIDWEKAAADGVEYALIRCGYRGYGSGKLMEDKYFEDNIEGALKAGIRVGVYFFTQAINMEEAIEEAEYTLDLIAPYDVTLPVCVDVEEINDTARTDILTPDEETDYAKCFMDRIAAAGYKTMIYSNAKYFIKKLNVDLLEGYDKWFAYYNDTIYFPYEIKAWQYSAEGTVDGIADGDVDLDITFEDW